jgi:hypothetical protein
MKNYLQDSARTASNTYFTDKATEAEVKETFETFAATGETLDNQKRRLFYGKGDALTGGEVDGFSINGLNGNIVHAIYGLCTEAGEISEAFLKEEHSEKPRVFLCHTIKGKGVDFMEHDNSWHYTRLNSETYQKALLSIDKSKL